MQDTHPGCATLSGRFHICIGTDIRGTLPSYINPTLSLPLAPGEADHDEHPHAPDQEDLQLEQGQRGAQPLSGRAGIENPPKKPTQKNPHKKTTKKVFLGFF
jgi:hypothetical protein